jgi:gluconolactonase
MLPWIDVIDPGFSALVLPNAPLEILGTGFGWLEGPVWFADANQLLVSDVPNDRILRWSEDRGMGVFRAPSGFANGHARDRQGRLVGCSHLHRCITRTELDGRVTILAERFEGRRLNSPNDIAVHPDGGIWFTDPLYGISTDYEGGRQISELPPRLYRFDPWDGALRVVADDFVGPNGLCFSPDGCLLYVAETGAPFARQDAARCIRVFDVMDGRHLRNGREFHRVNPGYADGLRADEDGRLWTSAADGVHCVAQDGTLLGKILTGVTVANLTFGGRNRSRLFICASHSLMAIYTNVRGVGLP